jgi:thiol-disulfide isomerase/thioredoxin
MGSFYRVAVLVLGAAGHAGCSPIGTTKGDAEKVAPPVAGRDGEGRFLQLSNYRGQVVLLDFWYTNCPHCRNFEPHEKALVRQYEGRPFVILGVNTDPDPETLLKTQQTAQLPWRSLWDGPHGSVVRDWGVQGFPTIYLIDHVGRVRFKSEGIPPSALATLRQKVDQLVHEAEQQSGAGGN